MFQLIRSSFIWQMVNRRLQQYNMKFLVRLFTLLFAIPIIAGCGKSSTDLKTHQDEEPPISSTPSLRLHWIGKKRLSAESNATNFISIWNMPESLKLETQTLDKLATAPWRLLTTHTALSNAPVALLRPLLDDLVQEECYLEIALGTNQLTEIVLAIKLPPDRTALWQTNIPTILKSIISATPETGRLTPNSYLLSSNSSLTFTRSGDWTLLSISDLRLLTSDFGLANMWNPGGSET